MLADSPSMLRSLLLAQGAQLDTATFVLFVVVLAVLAGSYVLAIFLGRQPESFVNPAIVRAFSSRIRAWWMMYSILIAAFLVDYFLGVGGFTTLGLFFLVSFWALREFITMTPTRRGDHRALFWVFFFITPFQYVLVALGPRFYYLYSVMIPVYASLFIPARIAIQGDPKRFLERSAKIQAGLFICVYALSYAPALVNLNLKTIDGTQWRGNYALLFYFILMVQLSDVLQYAWGKLLGRHVIASSINASRTWEGMIGGVVSTALLGMAFSWATPFGLWESALMSAVIAVMGSAGSMTLSAIKRDRGVTDYGTLVEGHPGVLDRIDSICFSAPVFYHLTMQFFAIPPA